MSVQAQIDRLTGAKTNLSTWLTGNGVTVPDGALLDELVALLGDVEVGGGAKVATGTTIFSEVPSTITLITFEHNLGVVPKIFAIYPIFKHSVGQYAKTNAAIKVSTEFSCINLQTRSSENYRGRYYADDPASILNSPNAGDSYIKADEKNIYMKTYLDTSFTVTVGDEYRWIVVG